MRPHLLRFSQGPGQVRQSSSTDSTSVSKTPSSTPRESIWERHSTHWSDGGLFSQWFCLESEGHWPLGYCEFSPFLYFVFRYFMTRRFRCVFSWKSSLNVPSFYQYSFRRNLTDAGLILLPSAIEHGWIGLLPSSVLVSPIQCKKNIFRRVKFFIERYHLYYNLMDLKLNTVPR